MRLTLERLSLAAGQRISLRHTGGSRKATKEAVPVIQVKLRGHPKNSSER